MGPRTAAGTHGAARTWPLRDAGPLTGQYSLVSDWHDRWLTGGLEPDVIAEAHLDEASVIAGVVRFAEERDARLARQRDALAAL